jgi:hypothetical protein
MTDGLNHGSEGVSPPALCLPLRRETGGLLVPAEIATGYS